MSTTPARKSGFFDVFRAVFWSFLGIRKRAEHEADVVRLNPVHVIIAGILGGVLFVSAIIVVVHFVIANAAR